MKLKTKITLFLIFAMIALTFNCKQLRVKNETSEKGSDTGELSVKMPQQKVVDKGVLVGDWVRTDAEYRVQVSELLNDGNMKAGYFNPKSIHVEKAMWAFDAGLLQIYIELKDENYPGSNYKLAYLPERDLLIGKYFQAVEGTTYDVEFVKKK